MKELTKSLEGYLEAVSEIISQKGSAKVRDVSEKMGFNMASTSEAVKSLALKGFLNYKPYADITLTEKGKEAVAEKLRRHEVITRFLDESLMLEKSCVEKYASDIEFSMPDALLSRFVEYLTFMQKCSCKKPKWLKSFQHYIEKGEMSEKCIRCSKNKEDFDNSMCCGCK